MLVDVTSYPVIDDHCHPCPHSREKRPFWRCFNSTLFEQKEQDAKSTILLHLVTNELRKFMQMDQSATMDEIIAERDRRYNADPAGWLNALAKDANIEQVIADVTYPITAWYSKKFITEAELNEYYSEVKEYKVRKEIRFEYIYDPIIPQKLSFAEFLHTYYNAIAHVVETEKPVSFKSVIGYITGLDVVKHTYNEGEIAYYRYLQDSTDFENE